MALKERLAGLCQDAGLHARLSAQRAAHAPDENHGALALTRARGAGRAAANNSAAADAA